MLAAAFSALLLAFPARAADGDPVQRYLADVYLGDRLDEVKRIYPPAQEWPSYIEPRGQVRRYRLARQYLKTPHPEIDTIFLGFKRGRVVEIQLIYTAEHSRRRSVEDLAAELSLIYGEPGRTGTRFWWSDGRTVLRAFYAEVPVLKDAKTQGVELRTSLQLVEESLYRSVD